MKIKNEYQCGVGRRKSKADVDTTARHAVNIIDWLDTQSALPHDSDDYKKLKRGLTVLQNIPDELKLTTITKVWFP
jgi:hypothetical protein